MAELRTWRGRGGAVRGKLTCAVALALAVQLPILARAEVSFVDVTGPSGLDYTTLVGRPFSEVRSRTMQIMQRNMGNGAAVADYDADGDLDIYLLGGRGYPNKLYQNDYYPKGTKTFTDVTPPALADLGHSRVAHFADLDNDGDLDLLLVNDDDGRPRTSASKLFRNDDGVFTDVSAGSGFRPIGALHCGVALADYDRDGRLDIFIGAWVDERDFFGRNRLYRNLGGMIFVEVTDAVGLASTHKITSFGAVFTDFDGNGYPDLNVAVDNFSDIFYWNDGGTFTDATRQVGATHRGNDMGLAPADFDNDDDLDVYSTNITDPDLYFGVGTGNVLYVNQLDSSSPMTFVDEAALRGVSDTYWGWGVEWIDVDNDTDLDLLVVTGFDEFVVAENPDTKIYQTPSVLFMNDGTGQFDRLLGAGLDEPMDSRTLIAFDFDRDGDRDLLITNHEQPVRLLENRTTDQGNWLDVAVAPDRMAIGARVYAYVDGKRLRRDIIAGRSYLAGTPSEVHFGLGEATEVETLRVEFADGSSQTYNDVAANQIVHVRPADQQCEQGAGAPTGELDACQANPG